MKRLFISITSVFLSSLFIISLSGFQTETPEALKEDDFKILESGRATEKNVSKALYWLAKGEYEKALEASKSESQRQNPWIPQYLEGLVSVSRDLVRVESDHFELFLPEDQLFLQYYALPALEKSYAYIAKSLKHTPKEKIRVEIYPNKEDFSVASTLSPEILKRSGAIGICKFHRLMIVSPQDLPLGYRWLDALSHEYIHLVVNEITHGHVELWLQEGTARYFETAYRLDPPEYLSASQKNLLIDAIEEDKLISFERMSPSLVYLKDQDEVSLAFAEVALAIHSLIENRGESKFKKFLNELKKSPYKKAFSKIYGQSPAQFESEWQASLQNHNWKRSRGAMSDEIQFEAFDEFSVIGASAKSQVRLGDRMRLRKRYKAALIQYQKALDQEPDNAVILLKLARTHVLLGENDKVIAPLERAVKKNPNYGTPHIELARWVKDLKRKEYHLLEANAINPFDPRIHLGLAQVYEEMGKMDLVKREKNILNHLSQSLK